MPSNPDSVDSPEPPAQAQEQVDERVDTGDFFLAAIPGLIGLGLRWISDVSGQQAWAWAGYGFLALWAVALVFIVAQGVRKGFNWRDLAGLAVVAGVIAVLDRFGWWF